jgi:hypothetical protein
MNKPTKILIICQIFVIILLSYALILRGFVTSATKLDILFTGAKTYYYTSEIVKSEIENRLPDKIQNNIIQKTIVTKALDYFVTPGLVQEVSKKPISRLITSLNRNGNAEIQNNKIVIDTASYTNQLAQSVNGWQLPTGLNSLATDAISSIPSQLTIVDLEKNPDSFVGYLVKARTYIDKMSNIIVVLSLILAGLIAGVFVANRGKIRKAFQAFGWVLGISGLLLILFAYLGPPILNSTIYIANPTTVDMLINNMVLNIGLYYLSIPGPYGVLFLLISAIIYLATKPNFLEQWQYLLSSFRSKFTAKKI